jgi:hypothetical protein
VTEDTSDLGVSNPAAALALAMFCSISDNDRTALPALLFVFPVLFPAVLFPVLLSVFPVLFVLIFSMSMDMWRVRKSYGL